MYWLIQATGALLNILWIALFLTPQPFTEFEQTKSTDEGEVFCFPPPPVKIPSNKSNNTKTTFPAHPVTAPGSEPTIMDSNNLGLTGRPPELEPTTQGSYPEMEPTTQGSYPEMEPTTQGSYPEMEPTIQGSYPEMEPTTQGSYPEMEPTIQGSYPEMEPTTQGSYPEMEPTIQGSYPEMGPTTQGSYPELKLTTPVSCCFEFFSGQVPLKDIKGYKKSHPTCPAEAVIILATTPLCVDPNAAWVKILLKTFDENGRQVNPEDSHSTPASGSESATVDLVELGLTTQGNPPKQRPMTPNRPPRLVLNTSRHCRRKRFSGPDCCFSFFSRRLNKKFICEYHKPDYRCPMPAVILVTHRNRHICVDPNLSWVQSIMESLDNRAT